MDKSYIVRVYNQENTNVSGIVEDVEYQTREKFSNPNQLWSLITSNKNDQVSSNIIQPKLFNVSFNNIRLLKKLEDK